MSQRLTQRQQEILDFIRQTQAEQGYPPTRAEIGVHFGFRSPNAAESHLKALARKGAISLRGGVSRGIALAEDQAVEQQQTMALPLVGRVAAGLPVLAAENIEDHYTVDPALFRPKPDYLLRVQGASMQDAGILDGDLLAVHRTPEALNHQIVVARIGDEVTVKRFQRHGARVLLLPENPDYPTITIDLRSQSVDIEGLGVGVIRTMD